MQEELVRENPERAASMANQRVRTAFRSPKDDFDERFYCPHWFDGAYEILTTWSRK